MAKDPPRRIANHITVVWLLVALCVAAMREHPAWATASTKKKRPWALQAVESIRGRTAQYVEPYLGNSLVTLTFVRTPTGSPRNTHICTRLGQGHRPHGHAETVRCLFHDQTERHGDLAIVRSIVSRIMAVGFGRCRMPIEAPLSSSFSRVTGDLNLEVSRTRASIATCLKWTRFECCRLVTAL